MTQEGSVLSRINEIDDQINRFLNLSRAEKIDATEVITALQEKKRRLWEGLGDWERVQIARHPLRPHAVHYIERMFSDFIEIHGDKKYGEDSAMITGLAKYRGRSVVVVAQEKGAETSDKIRRNFGMPHPEGYRKALRVMEMAEKFGKPLIVLVDTPGAYPGIGAEERGQGHAIAWNLFRMSRIRVPIVVTIIGEGASGGALGIGIGDSLLMLENAWFSVISPEGCAAILWKDAGRAQEAAKALKLTSRDLLKLGIIDEIVPEPVGGGHQDPAGLIDTVDRHVEKHLQRLSELSPEELIVSRYDKYRRMGVFMQ